jgi:peptide/nickel transport system substrate-binding protein
MEVFKMSRFKFLTTFVLIVLLVFGLILNSGCKKKVEVVTLTFAKAGDVVKLDPADVTDGESITVMNNIFEGLIRYKPGTTELEPWLAEKWDVSPDGKVFTFYLRKGVKFHDGTDFNADAVVFSFERQRDTNHPFHKYGEWEYWSWCFNEIEKVEKVDDYTVKITLSEEFAPFLTTMAMFTVYIVSPKNHEKWGAEASSHPVGTGPFKFVEWVKDDHITLEKFENYWGPKPKIDKLIFKVIPDASVRLLELQKGTIDGMEFPNPDDLEKIKGDKNLTLLTQPGLNIGYLAFNLGQDTPGYDPKLSDVRVRKAIYHAINRQDIIEHLYKGTAVVAKNPLPPTLWGYNDEIVDYEYNPDKAKELLKEAGYPNGFETNLWAMPVARPYMFDPQKIAEAIQSDLVKVGIKAKIVTYDWGTYLDKTEGGEHAMCLLGWTMDYPDPDNILYVLLDPDAATVGSAGNVAFYRNDKVHELNMLARKTYDIKEREKYYKEIQRIVHEDIPWVPLAHAQQMVVFRSNVKGFVLYPTGDYHFDTVYIEK